MTDEPFRLTLRQLPLPAKLVLTCFLIAVGLGYFSAMVQLHLRHSDRDGSALPTVDNVVERFSGLKKFDGKRGQSKIELLVLGDPDGGLTGSNMAPAFFGKSKGYADECKARGKETVDAGREAERQALLAWLRVTDPTAKQSAYDADAFPLPAEQVSRLPAAARAADAAKVRTLVALRCLNCHKEGGDYSPVLATWDQLAPLVEVPTQEVVRAAGADWVRSGKQMSVDGLTQSTHAHLLSFAVLFTLTGLVFAFSGWPAVVRGIIGPLVLVAQVCEIGCWWLARTPGVGPVFAMGIIALGSAVGGGLCFQIFGSLFSMYGWKGRGVVLLLAVAGLGGFLYLGLNVIEPALRAEREAATRKDEPKQEQAKPAVAAAVTKLERLVMGPRKADGGAWGSEPGQSMAEAFFEKSEGFRGEVKDRGEQAVVSEREGERRVVRAWIQLPDDARKKAYADNRMPLPTGPPVTADFVSDDKAGVKLRELLDTRCMRCHNTNDASAGEWPLESYEQFVKYLTPEK